MNHESVSYDVTGNGVLLVIAMSDLNASAQYDRYDRNEIAKLQSNYRTQQVGDIPDDRPIEIVERKDDRACDRRRCESRKREKGAEQHPEDHKTNQRKHANA